MGDDLDKALRGLAARPVPAELETIDDRVWARIVEARVPGPHGAVVVAAVAGAALFGMAADYLVEPAAPAAQMVLDSGIGLAPSTLLAGS
jgi:hypothetical protein